MGRTLALTSSAIVFDLWYTLICAEDHGFSGEVGPIAARLNLDVTTFAVYWTANRDAMHRTPRCVEDYVVSYLRQQARTLHEVERAVLDAVWASYDKALAFPAPAVLDVLRSLAEQGRRLGVLSNAHEREMRNWAFSPLSRLFVAACFSFQGGWMKPEPAAYRDILSAMGVRASQAVFVGDGASGELAGARAAGFAQIVFMRGLLRRYGVDEVLLTAYANESDAVIDDLGELVSVIN
jgi:putative hydrolase of the HAD superfamily